MVKCKNCKYLLRKVDKDFAHTGLWCPQIIDSPHEDMERNCEHYAPMTNGDRIRSLTDEELASVVMCPADITLRDTECDQHNNCMECTLDWLQRESEDHG